jgi:ribosomal protein L37AE/L43A
METSIARYQCRACGFDDHALWNGVLVCPKCGSTTEVRAAIATAEMTDAQIAAIAAARHPDEDV